MTVTLADAEEVVVVVVTRMRLSTGSRRSEVSLAGQFLLLQLVLVAVLLGVVAVLSLRQSTAAFERERGAQMRSTAEYVANLRLVQTTLTNVADGELAASATGRVLAPAAVQGLDLSGATTVSIVGTDGTVLASSDPTLVGRDDVLGASDVLTGRQWSGDVTTDEGRAVAGHAPVYSRSEGEVVGAVLADETYPDVEERLTGAAPDLVLFLGVGALLGGLGSYAVARLLKRRSQGLAPREIAQLADHRAALLHAIREGVVAVGTDGRVTMANDAARAVLGLDGDPRGRRVDELGLPAGVADLLTGAAPAEDTIALVGERVVVFNRREASAGGRGIGSVTTVRDRSELVALQGRLDANLSITDTLRAQTHEFDNLLHAISGLVQLEEYDELAGLVGELARTRAEVSDEVADRIADPAVAALLVAKHAVAAERGVVLDLDPGSRLPALEPALVADLTAVLGNLVDNAVDAAAGRPEARVEVWLLWDDRPEQRAVHVRVRDNGPGVPAERVEDVFVRGFSTKSGTPGGRGIGLALARMVCRRRGGEVMLSPPRPETDMPGAEFTAVLPIATPRGEDASGTEVRR
ncbi:PAS domain-containing protein [Nocardioides sp. BGMRC 2183]|nr:PAS domain-containing protein [Nocardioides sp. BGMRC 2183]